MGIFHGINLIKTGQCQRVIAGAVETPITPLTITSFQRMGALASTGAYPFDKHREDLGLGEGGAFFVLESEEVARRSKAKIYGQILGAGITADAYHGNVPYPQVRSVIIAIKQYLKNSNLKPEDIDFIDAYATTTQLNNKNYSLIIQHVFSH